MLYDYKRLQDADGIIGVCGKGDDGETNNKASLQVASVPSVCAFLLSNSSWQPKRRLGSGHLEQYFCFVARHDLLLLQS
jgi:hypothetical protein